MADINSDGTKQGKEVPTLKKSNALIKEHAPRAIARLEKLGATDVIDALGLRPYVKDKHV